MITQALQEIPVFQGLKLAEVEELSSWLQRKDFDAAKVVINEGDPSMGLFVLMRGTVEVYKGSGADRLVVAVLEGPSVVGEMGFLNDDMRSASVRSMSRVVTGFLPKALFMQQLQQNNSTAVKIVTNLAKIACRRLDQTTAKLLEVSRQSCGGHCATGESGVCNDRE